MKIYNKFSGELLNEFENLTNLLQYYNKYYNTRDYTCTIFPNVNYKKENVQLFDSNNNIILLNVYIFEGYDLQKNKLINTRVIHKKIDCFEKENNFYEIKTLSKKYILDFLEENNLLSINNIQAFFDNWEYPYTNTFYETLISNVIANNLILENYLKYLNQEKQDQEKISLYYISLKYRSIENIIYKIYNIINNKDKIDINILYYNRENKDFIINIFPKICIETLDKDIFLDRNFILNLVKKYKRKLNYKKIIKYIPQEEEFRKELKQLLV